MDKLFARLRHHARTRPTAVAVFSRYRPITYRKLWSRIERATARVQTEWQVQAGETVAYRGTAHPDALLLYLALARSGAMLLPLELTAQPDQPSSPDQPESVNGFPGTIRRLVVDDSSDSNRQFLGSSAHGVASPLSALIDQPCLQQPYRLLDNMEQPSLVVKSHKKPAAVGVGAFEAFEAVSLAWLWQRHARPSPAQEAHIDSSLLQPEVLGGIVLPTLLAGESLLIG